MPSVNTGKVLAVQEAAYKFEGTLRQFILDDKGAVAIVVGAGEGDAGTCAGTAPGAAGRIVCCTVC